MGADPRSERPILLSRADLKAAAYVTGHHPEKLALVLQSRAETVARVELLKEGAGVFLTSMARGRKWLLIAQGVLVRHRRLGSSQCGIFEGLGALIYRKS